MANNRVTKGLKDIADAIRAKTGDDGLMTAAEMPEKIEAIPVGIDPEGTKEISANGEFNVREFESVNVNVPGATTKDKLDVTENGEYNIAEYARVDVNVPNPSTGVLEINENGEYDVTPLAGINVNVPSNIENFNHSGRNLDSGYWYYFDGDYFTDYTDPSFPSMYPSEIDVSYKSEGGTGTASMDIGIYNNVSISYRFSGAPSYDSYTWYQSGKQDKGYYIRPYEGYMYACPDDYGSLEALRETSYDQKIITLTSLEVNEEVEFSFNGHNYKITRLN